MPRIELVNVTKRWGNYYAVDNLNMLIEDNSFITLLGPSGCGKTTTLRMIAGLETPTSGRITIGDTVVYDSEQGINIPASKRRVGFLFQNYALWPNMTVYNNISFGLKNIKEDLPLYDFNAKRCAKFIEILKKPEILVELIKDSKDKKGQIVIERALIKLIDYYEISIYYAKALLGFGLHNSTDYKGQAGVLKEEFEVRLNEIIKRHEAKGLKLSDNYEIMNHDGVIIKHRKLTSEEIDLRVRKVSRIVKIAEFMGRYPSELSGGQQQRVAIARTLAPEPIVLFMDEPLSNLDAKLRLEMRSELQRLHIDTGSTFVYVTHDQLEAMTLATKICLINNGVLQQYEAPLDIYKKPTNLFVADFVGNPSINFIEAVGEQVSDDSIKLNIFDGHKAVFKPNQKVNISAFQTKRDENTLANNIVEEENKKDRRYVEKLNKDLPFKYHISRVDFGMAISRPAITNNDFVIGVRPEFIRFSPSQSEGIQGSIYSVMPAGMETTVKIQVGTYLLTCVVFGGVTYKIGEKVNLDFSGDGILIFDRISGKLITLGKLEVK